MEGFNFGIDFGTANGNFNPEDLDVSSIIMAGFVVDRSGSTHTYVDDLNDAVSETTLRWQQSHHKDKILFSQLNFDDTLEWKFGYTPIASVNYEDITPGGTTKAIDALYEMIENSIKYREAHEDIGGDASTMIFMFTDGMDNASKRDASEVKLLLEKYWNENETRSSFEVFLFGIGSGNESYFEQLGKDMGVKVICQKAGDTRSAAEIIREQVTVVSQSVSSGSTSNLAGMTF